MCDIQEQDNRQTGVGTKIVPVAEAVGTVLSHDITEIRPNEFKGRAFRKGHIVRPEDIVHLQRLGKENLFILEIQDDEMHENDAALAIARALAGTGVRIAGEPNEGKINLVAEHQGLLKVNTQALQRFNMLGEVMCATMHGNTVVRTGQVVAGTRAIPLVVKKRIVEEAVRQAEGGVLTVQNIRKPRAGIVITGNEVYYGRIKDAFEQVIRDKIRAFDGEVVGVYFAPDDAAFIENRIRELIDGGADLIITSGGMSVDPDDVTRFAVRNLGCDELHYGAPVLPGSMVLVAYVSATVPQCHSAEVTEENRAKGRKRGSAEETTDEAPPFNSLLGKGGNRGVIPILGIPACGMYAEITVLDLVLPRILAGERIGRKELSELGHGGLCLKCETCRYPVCPFGK